jgi:hypothetical protein
MAADRQDAHAVLTQQLAELKAERGQFVTIYPDDLGCGLINISDNEVIEVCGTSTVRLGVWHDEVTNTYAGVQYWHHGSRGATDLQVVRVERVMREEWRVTP